MRALEMAKPSVNAFAPLVWTAVSLAVAEIRARCVSSWARVRSCARWRRGTAHLHLGCAGCAGRRAIDHGVRCLMTTRWSRDWQQQFTNRMSAIERSPARRGNHV